MISQTVEYAFRAMSFLGSLRAPNATCELISRETRVPRGYLSKVMRDLVCAELVKSFRGPHGGFSLARSAESISLLDIVNAVDPIRKLEGTSRANTLGAVPRELRGCIDNAVGCVESIFRRTTLGAVLRDGTGPKARPSIPGSTPYSRSIDETCN